MPIADGDALVLLPSAFLTLQPGRYNRQVEFGLQRCLSACSLPANPFCLGQDKRGLHPPAWLRRTNAPLREKREDLQSQGNTRH